MKVPVVIPSGRIRGTAVFARLFSCSIAVVFDLSMALGVLGSGRLELTPGFLAMVAWCAFVSGIAIRSFFLGVWVDAERLTVRTWWRTRRFALDSVVDVFSAGYQGMYAPLGVQWLRDIWLLVDPIGHFHVTGSMSRPKNSDRQCDEIRRRLKPRSVPSKT